MLIGGDLTLREGPRGPRGSEGSEGVRGVRRGSERAAVPPRRLGASEGSGLAREGSDSRRGREGPERGSRGWTRVRRVRDRGPGGWRGKRGWTRGVRSWGVIASEMTPSDSLLTPPGRRCSVTDVTKGGRMRKEPRSARSLRRPTFRARCLLGRSLVWRTQPGVLAALSGMH